MHKHAKKHRQYFFKLSYISTKSGALLHLQRVVHIVNLPPCHNMYKPQADHT